MTAENKPHDALESLVSVFEAKGWLNQMPHIRHRDRRYRIFCSKKKFLVYRINDNCHVRHSFPGLARMHHYN